MSKNFNELGIMENLIEALNKEGINVPTDVQEKVIPLAMEGKNVIAQSETGTGKTLAYLIPIVEKIDVTKNQNQAIIMAPTHELAMQIDKVLKSLIENSGMNVTSFSVIGGVHIQRQVEKLKQRPHIIIASGSRVLDFIKNKRITAHTIKTVVIDEADRMLDKHNIDLVKSVIKATQRDRQLMMFSASITDRTLETVKDFTENAEIVKLSNNLKVSETIEHWCFIVDDRRKKFELLRKILAAVKPEKTIIFINKSEEVAEIVEKLKYHNFSVNAMHGASHKLQRQKALEDFKKGKINILVSSDLSARGMDIKGVTHILNLDIPEEPKDYLHRAGRCGRAGEHGTCISIINETEISKMLKFDRTLELDMDVKDIHNGKIIDKQ